MISSTSNGRFVASPYVTSLLAQAADKAATAATTAAGSAAAGGAASTATKTQTAIKTTAQAALTAASGGFRASAAMHALDQRKSTLTTALNASLGKAGVSLSAPLEFSVDKNGALSVGGSAADQAAIAGVLKADKTSPSLSARMVSLVNDADSVSAGLRQSAAMSQAARYAGKSGNVLSLYATLAKQQDAGSAVFGLANGDGSLTYPGMLVSKA